MEIAILFKIFGLGLVLAGATALLKNADKGEIATWLTVAGILVALMWVVDGVVDFITKVKSVFNLY